MKLKESLILIISIILSISSFSQNVIIPDPNFKSKLIELGIDTDGDGEISYTEASEVNGTLLLSNSSIADLTGISAFLNISQLNVGSNQLTELDISELQNITTLDCSFNSIVNLKLPDSKLISNLNCNHNQIDSLVIDGFNQLKSFECKYDSMHYLKMANNTVTTLQSFDCSNNQFDYLEINNIQDIGNLVASFAKIKECKIEKIRRIDLLNLNSNDFEVLDLSSVLSLGELIISNNSNIQRMCVGIKPPPFSIIDENTLNYEILNCSPEPGNNFTAGQISNTFNYQYGLNIPLNDTIDINGDGIGDIYSWTIIEYYQYGMDTYKYLGGINNTIISGVGTWIYNVNPFTSLVSPNFSWSSNYNLFVGWESWEMTNYNYHYNIETDKYLAIRSTYTEDTVYSWIQFDNIDSPCPSIISYASWKPCSPPLNLGQDTTIFDSDSIVLEAGENFEYYYWSTGDTTHSIIFPGPENGVGEFEITCLVGYGACFYEDTIKVEVVESFSITEAHGLDITIFPNPVKDHLYIEIDENQTGPFIFELMDITGKNVLTIEKKNNPDQIHEIELQNLQKGIYLLRITTYSESFTRKIILK